MNVGFPSHRFFADNGSKFSNVKLDELTSKLGLSVKFGPAYSPWSNGLNERNHASADTKYFCEQTLLLSSPIGYWEGGNFTWSHYR